MRCFRLTPVYLLQRDLQAICADLRQNRFRPLSHFHHRTAHLYAAIRQNGKSSSTNVLGIRTKADTTYRACNADSPSDRASLVGVSFKFFIKPNGLRNTLGNRVYTDHMPL